MTSVAAVILAGGRAERLRGINKALVEVGGSRLIDRCLNAVTDCAPVLLAHGPIPFEVAGTRSIADLPTDYAGPLAGFAAAVHRLAGSDTAALLSLAVDTPFFPGDFLTRALPLLAQAPAVIAAYGGQDYPTNALWQLEAVQDLPAALADGSAPHSLKRLAAGLGALRLDYAAWAPEDPFANVNTPEDLALLRRRAGS